ncbi:MAG: HIT family protein [Nanoarchaeota archaeon]
MNCTVCSIAQKHVAAKIVYEDAAVIAYFSPDPSAVGHIIVVPKQHTETLEELPDAIATQLFYVASYTASAVYEGLASQGTNIICNNGPGAGIKGHVTLHIIPRKENDGLSFVWEPKQVAPADFDDIVKKVKDKADYIGVKKETRKVSVSPAIVPSSPQSVVQESVETSSPEEPQKEVITKGDEENYMIKHLYRIP